MRILCVILAAALTACASGPRNTAYEAETAAYRGEYSAARELAFQAIQEKGDIGRAWYVLGIVHAKAGRVPQAVDAMNTAARYGSEEARVVLTKAGRPIPVADLQLARAQPAPPRPAPISAGPDPLVLLFGAAVQGYTQGRAPSQSDAPTLRTDCTSQERFGGRVDTTCKTK